MVKYTRLRVEGRKSGALSGGKTLLIWSVEPRKGANVPIQSTASGIVLIKERKDGKDILQNSVCESFTRKV